MQPFSNSAGTNSRQDIHTDAKPNNTTNTFNIFEIAIVSQSKYQIELTPPNITKLLKTATERNVMPGTKGCTPKCEQKKQQQKSKESSDIENNNQVL